MAESRVNGIPRRFHRHRTPWQRIVYPVVGVVCLAIGIIGVIIPVIPGWPLFVLGVPLLFAMSPRLEARCRHWLHCTWCWIRQRRGKPAKRCEDCEGARPKDDM